MTIKEIARRAGVSIGTVDRVLHNRGRVSPETSERVMRIVRETGYTPDPHASHLSTAKRYVFAILCPRGVQDGGYWELPRVGFRHAASELAGFRIETNEFLFDRNDPASFREAARRLIENPPDGIVLAPVLPNEAASFVRTIPREVPYVFFDTDLPGTGRLTYVGQDSFRSGALAAKLVRLLEPRPERIAVVQLGVQDYHIADRIGGFLSAFPSLGRPIIHHVDRVDDPGQRETFFARLFAQPEPPSALFVTNASCHWLAEEIKKVRPAERPVHIVGYDLIPRSREALIEGRIDFIIGQRPELQASEALKALHRHVVLHRAVPDRIVMPIDIITAENVDFYDAIPAIDRSREVIAEPWNS